MDGDRRDRCVIRSLAGDASIDAVKGGAGSDNGCVSSHDALRLEEEEPRQRTKTYAVFAFHLE